MDARTPPTAIAARIGELRRELAALEQQQRQELAAAIVVVIGPGVCFSARELWAHRVVNPDLDTALSECGCQSPRQLGKKLKQLGLTRVGLDEHGVVWMCD